MVTLLLAAGIGVLSLNQDHRGPGPDLSGQTTTVSALPGLTSPPANSTTAPVDQVERTLTGHTGTVCAIATAQLDGRPVLISGSWDKTVRVWDLNTGTAIGSPFIGHTDLVLGVAATQLNGRLVVISGSKDDTVRVSDLATGAPIGKPFAGHTDTVFAVATAQLDGRPMIVSGSADKTVRVWDLTTGAPVGTPLTGHTSHVFALTTAQLNGRPVVISGSADKTVRSLGPRHRSTDREALHWSHRLRDCAGDSAAQRTVRRDLRQRRQDSTCVGPRHRDTDREALHRSHRRCVRFDLDAAQRTARGDFQQPRRYQVRVWDLATGAPIGTPHTDHAGGVWAAQQRRWTSRPQ